MTEQEWLESTDPLRLLTYCCDPKGGPKPPRKADLLAVAGSKLIWYHLPRRYQEILGQIEELADDSNSQETFGEELDGMFDVGDAASREVHDVACILGWILHCGWSQADEDPPDELTQRILLSKLLRDIFGNPFHPVAFDPRWQSSTAVGLAQTMYDARDFGAMPILADALQDAGCEDDAILSHCRDAKQQHVRGCWVVDLVLGKS